MEFLRSKSRFPYHNLVILISIEVSGDFWAQSFKFLSGQSFWLQIQRSRVRFPALPDFLSSIGSGTGSTQHREPREVN